MATLNSIRLYLLAKTVLLNNGMDNEAKKSARLEELIAEINTYSDEKKEQLVSTNPMNIGLMLHPTEKLQMLAITLDPRSVTWIKNPTTSVVVMAKLLS